MRNIFTFFLALASTALFAQVKPESAEYHRLKKEGKLPVSNGPMIRMHDKTLPLAEVCRQPINHPPITQASNCQCMIPLDSTFSVVPMVGGSPPDYRNDDSYSNSIPLPFTFCFYGNNITSCFINNNGNISFGAQYGTFTATGFPDPSFSMIAPFWADVDTRDPGSGLVWYKVTPTALIVKWEAVGYYSFHVDKVNTFQLIITDGTDPLVPGGNNVSFCYGNMDWTTGDASSGVNGFGGSPATVGANEGNGIDFIQFGQFDSPGSSYSGPFPVGPPYEGIDWLDYKSFVFSTCNSNNIAPIVSGLAACDTIKICEGDTLDFNVSFLSPEQNQTTTATVSAPGVNGFTLISNTPGNSAVIAAQLIADGSNYGYNTITFSGTDNGSPVQTTTITVVVQVDTFAAPLPVITGQNEYCQGGPGVTLDAGAGYTGYDWNPSGQTTQVINNVTQGTYTVTVSFNGCSKSATFTVNALPLPVPVINGVIATCGTDSAELDATDPAYVSYAWSTGATTPGITVGNGVYIVTVTDTNGCTGSSAPLNVVQGPEPQAAFNFLPLTSFIGDSVRFNDLSTVSSGNITQWSWVFGDNGTSGLQDPTHVYTEPGTYLVCLAVATQQGCNDTICMTYEVMPYDVIPPNVFSPNGDGKNETLAFKNLEFYGENHLVIFNRWGNRLYEKDNYVNDWNGKGVSDGVYYYVLDIPTLGKTLKGFVHILR